MKRLSIVISSTRPGRVGPHVAQWVAAQLGADWDIRLQDLAAIDLPFLDEEEAPAKGRYARPHTIAWANEIRSSDAVVVVTPQYNASYPAPIKNAIDYLFAEWRGKPVALVGYGWGGATGATADLARVLAHLKAEVVGSIGLSFNTDLTPAGELQVSDARVAALTELSDALAAATQADAAA